MSHEAATMTVRDDHGGFFVVVVIVSDQAPLFKSYVTHHQRTVIDWDDGEADWVTRPEAGPFSPAEWGRIEAAAEALSMAFDRTGSP